MILYWLIILIYSIINIELKEIKIKKSLLLLDKEINNKNTINNTNYNLFIFSEQTAVNKTKNSEDIFKKHGNISFVFLFTGIFIMLYGGYYYKFSLIIHFTLFLYHIIVIISPDIPIIFYQIYFVISCITGLLIYLILNTDEKTSKRFKIQKIIYGSVLGCFIHQIFFYYINFFFDENNYEKYDIIYYISFFSFVLIFGIINFFIPDNRAFLPCSTISSSFYIIKCLDFIIDANREINKKENFITNIIIQFIIFILSFIYQIYHNKYKELENPNIFRNEKYESEPVIITEIVSNATKSCKSIDVLNSVESKDKQFLKNSHINQDDEEEDEINEQED